MPTPEEFLWVYDDPGRGLALIRGRGVRAVLQSAGLEDRARYSMSGKGWVISRDAVADLAAYADHADIPYRTKVVTS